jgi:hypothetical protein
MNSDRHIAAPLKCAGTNRSDFLTLAIAIYLHQEVAEIGRQLRAGFKIHEILLGDPVVTRSL